MFPQKVGTKVIHIDMRNHQVVMILIERLHGFKVHGIV